MTPRYFAKVLAFSLTATAFFPALGDAQQAPAGAQAMPAAPRTVPSAPFSSGIGLSKGSGKIINLPRPVASIFAADPNVVEVRPASPSSLFVFGKDVGATTIVATDGNGNTVAQYAVTVGPNPYPGDRLSQQATANVPGSSVTAESEPGGMVVSGSVQTPADANQVMNQAKLISPTGTVINNLQVQQPIQVELKVRIAYMSRNVSRQLGIDWQEASEDGFSIGKFLLSGGTNTLAPTISGTNPAFIGVGFPSKTGSFEGIIDALATDGLAHIVAEPTLTTLSGTQANFLVGGQFPIPVAEQNDTISVEFKSYGIQLTFTPTVFSDGRISLQVSPQLSQLSSANSVTASQANSSTSIVIPALTVQQASSTVVLGSGQGMAIAGLLADNTNQSDNAVPGLGEIPVLGALFRGDTFQRQQTELVIAVTPYLVNPVNNTASLAMPDDGWTPPNDLQRILMLRDNGSGAATAAIPGQAGFMVQ